MPSSLSIQSYIDVITAGQPRKPSPIKNALQAIMDWAAAGFIDSDIRSGANIDAAKLLDASVTSRKLKPTKDLLAASADVTLNSSTRQTATGCSVTLTPATASYLYVKAWFDVDGISAGQTFQGTLNVDGSTQSGTALFVASATSDRKNVAMGWKVALTVAEHTFSIQGLSTSNAGTMHQTHTKMEYEIVSQ